LDKVPVVVVVVVVRSIRQRRFFPLFHLVFVQVVVDVPVVHADVVEEHQDFSWEEEVGVVVR
jgi:hypothetical protein